MTNRNLQLGQSGHLGCGTSGGLLLHWDGKRAVGMDECREISDLRT